MNCSDLNYHGLSWDIIEVHNRELEWVKSHNMSWVVRLGMWMIQLRDKQTGTEKYEVAIKLLLRSLKYFLVET